MQKPDQSLWRATERRLHLVRELTFDGDETITVLASRPDFQRSKFPHLTKLVAHFNPENTYLLNDFLAPSLKTLEIHPYQAVPTSADIAIIIPAIEGLRSLTTLHISLEFVMSGQRRRSARWIQDIAEAVLQPSSLTKFDLINCVLTEDMCTFIATLSNIASLKLHSRQAEVGEDTYVTERVLKHISAASLTELDLLIADDTPTNIGAIIHLTSLVTLRLETRHRTPPELNGLACLNQLEDVSLHVAGISESLGAALLAELVKGWPKLRKASFGTDFPSFGGEQILLHLLDLQIIAQRCPKICSLAITVRTEGVTAPEVPSHIFPAAMNLHLKRSTLRQEDQHSVTHMLQLLFPSLAKLEVQPWIKRSFWGPIVEYYEK